MSHHPRITLEESMRESFVKVYAAKSLPELKSESIRLRQVMVHSPTKLNKMKYEIVESFVQQRRNKFESQLLSKEMR
jgi:hypothetical protein